MKCLILAAGYATRMYPLTENFPKPLLTIGNKAIIDWLIDDLMETTSINEFIVITNHKFYSQFEDWKLRKLEKTFKGTIEILDDGTSSNESRLGAVKDIMLAIDTYKIKEDILVVAGDNILDFSLSKFVKFSQSKNTSCVMCHAENDINKQRKTAIIEIDESNKITSYEEKPMSPKGNLAVPPFYYYVAKDIDNIQLALEDGCNYDAPGSYASWLSKSEDMYAYIMEGNRYDIGDIEGYNQIKELLK